MPAERRFWYATLIVIAVYIVSFVVFTFGRYERYNATGFDLAFYDQILWRTARGDLMGVSIEGNNVSNWAFHVEPILLLVAPLTLIFSDTRWLLVLQTAALAVAAIPVYRIAVRRWQKNWAGFLFALLYLLYPCVGWANKFDFHPLTLTTPLLLFAWDAAELRQFRIVSFLLLLALLCKEEMGFVVALFGLYWYFAAQWRVGLLWTGVGIIYSLVGLFVIIPTAQGRTDLAWQVDLRYRWLFRGTWEERIAYITGPDTPVKFRFLVQLLLPLFFTPLLKPRILAIATPVLVLSLLSSRAVQFGIFHHYMSNVVPFLMVAAIHGSYDARTFLSRKILKLRPPTAQRLTLAAMLVGTLTMFILYNPFLFVPREPYAPTYGWESGASLEGLRAAEKVIPPDSCLTTSNNIAAHYGQRQYIYVFGIGKWDQCDLSMVDLADTRFVSFGVPQQMACQQFLEQNYSPIFSRDNVVILQRGATPIDEYSMALRTYCEQLAQ